VFVNIQRRYYRTEWARN